MKKGIKINKIIKETNNNKNKMNNKRLTMKISKKIIYISRYFIS